MESDVKEARSEMRPAMESDVKEARSEMRPAMESEVRPGGEFRMGTGERCMCLLALCLLVLCTFGLLSVHTQDSKNFTARRGTTGHMYSDNESNFACTPNESADLMDSWNEIGLQHHWLQAQHLVDSVWQHW